MSKYLCVGACLIATIFEVGCTSTKGYEKILDTWINDTEANLVSKWGPPQGLYISPEGDRTLTYESHNTMTLPGYSAPTTTFLSGSNYGGSFYGTATSYNHSTPPTVLNLMCQTNFTIHDGKIVAWRYKGNNCRA